MRRQGQKETRVPPPKSSPVAGEERGGGTIGATIRDRFHYLPILVLMGFLFGASNVEAATAEETLAGINRLPPTERQATLIREAKKEGVVIWYAAMNREDLRQFTSAFEAEYPFLKVEVLTSGPQSLLNRILTEYRAGKYTYDTLNVRSSALYTLKKANAVMRYDTPNRKALRAGFYDKEGYMNGLWASLLVYLFNTHQVSRAQAPKSIDDLLEPKWRGKLGMDKDADDWLAAVLDFYGDDKGKQMARALGAQKLQIRNGRSLVSQLVAAGEFPVQIDAHHHEAVALRKAGAPVDYVFPEPFIPVKAVSAFVLSSQPSHPYAAALLVDFMLSRKGQEIAYRQNRWPAHKELATGGSDDVGNRKTVVPNGDKWGSRYEELVQLSSLLGR
jgi:iron(III) transport system substrate-binding protein